jgi:pterin-4a-carbinolamine dehydratase
MEHKKVAYPDFSGELPPPRITVEEIQLRLNNELKDWELIESPLPENPLKKRKELHRVFLFGSFNEVVDFLIDLKPICDILPHHPRVENLWKTLHVYLSTWALDYDISYKDIQLAMNMDKLYRTKYHKEHVSPRTKSKKDISDFQKALQQLVGEDRIQDALEELKNYYLLNRDKKTPNELVSLTGQFHSIKNKEIVGDLSTEEVMRYDNKLRNSILAIIEKLDQ